MEKEKWVLKMFYFIRNLGFANLSIIYLEFIIIFAIDSI